MPEKYRITVNCAGFSESSIKTEVKNNHLVVEGAEGDPAMKGTDDYSLKEFKRTFELPSNILVDKMVSFLTAEGMLVVEFPFKEVKEKKHLYPKIVESEGIKRVELQVVIPENVDPSKVTVTCKDNDVIVRADYRVQKPDGFSRIHYLRRSTFPQNTNWDSLKCLVNQHDLQVSAELGTKAPRLQKMVPIQIKQ